MAWSDARGPPQVRQHEKTYTRRIANTQNFLPPKLILNFKPGDESDSIPRILKPDYGVLTAYTTHESLVGSNMVTSADTSVSSGIVFFFFN